MNAVRILKNKIHGLQESNPMLGLRGCRLGIRHPGALRAGGAAGWGLLAPRAAPVPHAGLHMSASGLPLKYAPSHLLTKPCLLIKPCLLTELLPPLLLLQTSLRCRPRRSWRRPST